MTALGGRPPFAPLDEMSLDHQRSRATSYRWLTRARGRSPELGATGAALVKDTEPADLIQAVRVVARGDALLSPGSVGWRARSGGRRGRRPPGQAAGPPALGTRGGGFRLSTVPWSSKCVSPRMVTSSGSPVSTR